jgi:hypothetical protein
MATSLTHELLLLAATPVLSLEQKAIQNNYCSQQNLCVET